MHWRSATVLTVLFVSSLAVAGCADKPAAKPSEEQILEDLGLQATADTGIVRGVVFDPAIQPLPDVVVHLTGNGAAERSTASNAQGAFGFDGLAAGTYFLRANKTGYLEVQQSVEVVAGVPDPPAVKIQLPVDEAALPYYAAYVMDGFLTCSARIALTAYPAGECLESDTSQVTYDLDRVPDWAQSEMIWKSTQMLGDAMSLVSECFRGVSDDPDPCPNGNLVINRSEGSSPLIIKFNHTLLQQFRVGDDGGNPFRLRVFAAGRQDTDVVDEEALNRQLNSTTGGLVPCVAWPAINSGCFRVTGVGVILQQKFSVYTHVFYGYAPPEAWLFTTEGSVPPPPK